MMGEAWVADSAKDLDRIARHFFDNGTQSLQVIIGNNFRLLGSKWKQT
jgi:hypothetical protein